MKNAGLAGAIALCGIGLIMIGLENFVSTPRAMAAAPAVAAAVEDEGEPTIVWYEAELNGNLINQNGLIAPINLYRAWSTGRIERSTFSVYAGNQQSNNDNCLGGTRQINVSKDPCWVVIDDPKRGTASLADIDGNQHVDGQDLATLLSMWGEGSRRLIDPSQCELNLINPVAKASSESKVVWLDLIPFQIIYPTGRSFDVLLRGWSNGVVEARLVVGGGCQQPCTGQPGDEWNVVSSPADGYLSSADFDFDESVSGEDLAILLSSWGDAPSIVTPTLECPLGLMN